ncbi:hypothetical protein OOZ63_16825 [Paucibacter sp. PLA-PC-4]|uniref:hypothetical protein n=1 Tax=Paucibacter sp. PLA-PC-4 TaxID=2993655 RepID=UPI00224A9AC8|nr:hypothetical protein [Paucibacter sp. PLA-PC-4]MCX2863497.1 hypothetical protein [Paucibacter sp. PLA-PC-4]
MVQLVGLAAGPKGVGRTQRLPALAAALLGDSEPLAQLDLALAGAPQHAVVIGHRHIAGHPGGDADGHAGRFEAGAKCGLGAAAVAGVVDLTVQHLGMAQHALQHEDEVRQHLASEAAFLTFGQPGTGAGLPRARPGGESHFEVDRAQRAQR